MIKRIFKLWISIGYSAMMIGTKKGAKIHSDWRGFFKYMFNLYFFFLLNAIITNIVIAIFPKNLNFAWFLILPGLTAIYIYGFNKTYDKLLDKLNYDPSKAYKKNTRKEIIAMILFVISKLIIVPLYAFSFAIQNLFR